MCVSFDGLQTSPGWILCLLDKTPADPSDIVKPLFYSTAPTQLG